MKLNNPVSVAWRLAKVWYKSPKDAIALYREYREIENRATLYCENAPTFKGDPKIPFGGNMAVYATMLMVEDTIRVRSMSWHDFQFAAKDAISMKIFRRAMYEIFPRVLELDEAECLEVVRYEPGDLVRQRVQQKGEAWGNVYHDNHRLRDRVNAAMSKAYSQSKSDHDKEFDLWKREWGIPFVERDQSIHDHLILTRLFPELTTLPKYLKGNTHE